MGSLGLPNIITLTRLIAIPFISYFYLVEQYDWALYLLMYAGFSDLLDGGLARFMKQRTKLGAILDPAADKILMFVMFITLAWARQIPFWLMLLVFLRDLYIVTGVFILKFRYKKVYIRPTYVSKMTTFFQLSLLFFCLLLSYLPIFPFGWGKALSPWVLTAYQASFLLTVIFTVASGIHYTLVGIALYRGKLHEVPSPEETVKEAGVSNH
ncbi:MAG: CDP-alcohol phosphatidyltransferase family protein [bacterium]